MVVDFEGRILAQADPGPGEKIVVAPIDLGALRHEHAGPRRIGTAVVLQDRVKLGRNRGSRADRREEEDHERTRHIIFYPGQRCSAPGIIADRRPAGQQRRARNRKRIGSLPYRYPIRPFTSAIASSFPSTLSFSRSSPRPGG